MYKKVLGLALAVGMFSIAVPAFAATVDVTDGSIATLQAAIDGATAGDTITVSGAYSGDVTLSKEISLVGNSASLTGKITITSGTSSVSGFDITNPDAGYGITMSDVSNVSVSNNVIHDIGTNLTAGSAQAIYAKAFSTLVTGITITGNQITNVGSTNLEYSGSGSAKGIFIGDSNGSVDFDGVTINNNTISGVAASGSAWPAGRGAYGILVNHSTGSAATKNLVISSNTISNLNGLWAHGIGLEGNTPDASVTGNTISGLIDHKTPTDAYAVFFDDNASKTTVLIDGATLGDTNTILAQSSLSGTGGNPVVTYDGHSYIYGVNAFSTIQAAIDAASTGATVNVAPGTYLESVTTTKSLTISGGTGTKPVISGNGSSDFILKINNVSAGATVSNIEINGQTTTPGSNGYFYGILVNDSGTSGTPVELSNLTVKNVWSSAGANGIEVDASVIGGSYANIHGTTIISSFQKRGVRFINSSGKVYDIEVIGDNVDGTSRVQNLINLWGGSEVEIYNNQLHNALTTGGTPTWDSPAIFISSYGGLGNSTANIHDNEIYSSDTGVVVGSSYAPGDGSTATINNNDFHDLNTGVNFEVTSSSATVNENSFINVVKGINNNDEPTGQTVDATLNWWGASTGPTNATTSPSGTGASIYDEVSFSPWYSDSGMTTLRYTTTENSSGGQTTTIPSEVNETLDNGSNDVTVTIPTGTVITGGPTWDGALTPPTVITTTVIPTQDTGITTTPTLSIEVGAGDNALTFDQPVKLVFANQAGTLVGWSRNGTFTRITDTCDSATAPTLASGADCKIDVGVVDLVVWTRHFTTFTTYTQTAVSSGGSSGGGGGGGNGAPVGSGGSVTPASSGSTAGTGTGSGTGTGVGGEVLGAAAYNFAVNLGFGSKGTDVTALQQILIDAGFLNITAPTGYFGSLTSAAVKKYQAAHGIAQVGVVGPVTRAALNQGSGPSGSSSLTEPQIQAIIGLLQSFGADASIVTSTEKALRNR